VILTEGIKTFNSDILPVCMLFISLLFNRLDIVKKNEVRLMSVYLIYRREKGSDI